jgi:hypothetical protein
VVSREIGAEKIVLVDHSERNILSCKPVGVECILFERNAGDSLTSLS